MNWWRDGGVPKARQTTLDIGIDMAITRRRPIALAAGVLVVGLCSVQAFAQKAPGLGYAFPPAATIGRTTDVQLGGFDFTPDMQWFVHDAAVKFEILGPPGDYHLPPPPYWFGPRAITAAPAIPREVAACVSVSADAGEGLVRWQVANANGSSGTAMLLLSRDREIVERRSRELPQRVESLSVGVSGRLSRFAEVDRYEFVADRDGLVTVELMARRFGSDFNGVLEARDANGRLLADFADTLGRDGAITFAVRRNEAYSVSLHDVDFRGDRAYVYRLAFRYGPRVTAVLPAFGKRGSTREIEFVGVGIATGAPRIESVRQTVTFPSDAEAAAFSHRLQTPAGEIDISVPLSDSNERTRDVTNAASAQSGALAVAAPVGITGRFSSDESEHRYAWRVEKDEFWSISAVSRAIGGRLDVALVVLDSEGKPVAENDDSATSTDADLSLRAAAAGEYTCIVRAMSPTSGAMDEVYRLEIARPLPDFVLTTPQQLHLPLGGKAEITVQAVRTGGFDGANANSAIALAIDGLPAGVAVEGELVIPAGRNEAKLVLTAEANAAVVAAPLTIRGTATIDEKTIARTATAIAAGNLAPRTAAEQRSDRVMLAMTMMPPFELKLVDGERQRDVPRGTTYRAEFDVTRKNGFAGKLRIEMSAQQDRQRQGVRGGIVDVPADADRVVYPCFMPEWLSTDLTRRLVVNGVGIVPDPQGNARHLVQPAVGRITMIMEGALLKLTADASELTVRPGDTFDVPASAVRSAKFPAEATVELVVPEELSGIVSADAVKLAADQNRGVVRIATTADARLAGDWPLTLTATAMEDGKWPVVAQTEIVIRFRLDR
jgi:hypothetical protein